MKSPLPNINTITAAEPQNTTVLILGCLWGSLYPGNSLKFRRSTLCIRY